MTDESSTVVEHTTSEGNDNATSRECGTCIPEICICNIPDSNVALASYYSLYSFAAVDFSYVIGHICHAEFTVSVVIVRGVNGSETEAYDELSCVRLDGV